MRNIVITFTTLLFLLSFSPLFSQVSNFTVNGSNANFTMTSGDVVNWSFSLPAGATATGEIWIDLNANQTIDPGTDRRLFLFGETDGDTLGMSGPPDMDGLVNGAIEVSIAVGFAPQHYVMRFTHNGVGESIAGSVTPLSPAAYTITGTVSGPPSTDLSYFVVEVDREGSSGVQFWHGLTDSAGQYTIEIDSDTTGNPWRARMTDPPQPYLASPTDTLVTINGNVTGLNFTVQTAAAQVVGQLLDESGDSLAFSEVQISRVDSFFTGASHYSRTDPSGRFWFGIPAGELTGASWILSQPYDDRQPVPAYMFGRVKIPVLSGGDSLVYNLVSYTINSSIQGFVQVNGVNPGFPVRIYATNEDTAESFAWSDSATGSFSIPVSDRIADFNIAVWDFFGGYDHPTVTAHPGDVGVIYNLTTTGVDDGPRGIPSEFALGQNYPNPFNPATTIPYTIPSRAPVVLSVYDVLGRQVAVLVNEIEEPGAKLVTFDAGNLPSGVYSYRITSGSYSQVRKMLVMK